MATWHAGHRANLALCHVGHRGGGASVPRCPSGQCDQLSDRNLRGVTTGNQATGGIDYNHPLFLSPSD
ncbi:hypothetical protein HAX54_020651, partial [Datura stramonium]|nr:hypothetical protein [Datura stramonium]